MNPTSPQSPEPPTIQDRDHQCAASFLHRICTRRAGYPPYTRVASDTERQIDVRVSIAWNMMEALQRRICWRDSEAALNVQLLSRYPGPALLSPIRTGGSEGPTVHVAVLA